MSQPTNMNKGMEFLDKYSRLENLIERNYNVGSESPILFLARKKEFSQYYAQLNYAREVRNILSHNPRFEDEYIVEPSEAMLDFLEEIITMLDTPLSAQVICTPACMLLVCRPQDYLLPIVSKMQEKGLSHAPVVDDGRIIGVFSRSSLFAYIAYGGKPDKDTRVSMLAAYLDFANARGVYDFAPVDATLVEVQSMFERSYKAKDKLSVVFLTEGGTQNGKLFGLITPADFLKRSLRPKMQNK